GGDGGGDSCRRHGGGGGRGANHQWGKWNRRRAGLGPGAGGRDRAGSGRLDAGSGAVQKAQDVVSTNFTWTKVAKQYDELYRRLLGEADRDEGDQENKTRGFSD